MPLSKKTKKASPHTVPFCLASDIGQSLPPSPPPHFSSPWGHLQTEAVYPPQSFKTLHSLPATTNTLHSSAICDNRLFVSCWEVQLPDNPSRRGICLIQIKKKRGGSHLFSYRSTYLYFRTGTIKCTHKAKQNAPICMHIIQPY